MTLTIAELEARITLLEDKIAKLEHEDKKRVDVAPQTETAAQRCDRCSRCRHWRPIKELGPEKLCNDCRTSALRSKKAVRA